MKVLLTGAQGMLGRHWHHAMKARGWTVTAFSRSDLDITSPETVSRAVETIRPEWVANAAAYADVDGCELNPVRADAVNRWGPSNLAAACRRSHAILFHLSTDYIFDGLSPHPYREADAPNPLSVYGRSKWQGESAVRESGTDFCLVRTSWLYAEWGRNFVLTIRDLAGKGQPLRVVNDQIGAPTFAGDLAEALCRLMEAGAQGVFHVTNAGFTSWYGLAGEILRLLGLEVPLAAISSTELSRPATRPANSRLDDTHFKEWGLEPLRSWNSALADCLGRISDDFNRLGAPVGVGKR